MVTWDPTRYAQLGAERARPFTDLLRGVLRGAEPVADPSEYASLLAERAERLRVACPRQPWGTPLPFRRVFCVAQAPGASA